MGQPGTRGLNKRRPSRATALKSPHSSTPARETREPLESQFASVKLGVASTRVHQSRTTALLVDVQSNTHQLCWRNHCSLSEPHAWAEVCMRFLSGVLVSELSAFHAPVHSAHSDC